MLGKVVGRVKDSVVSKNEESEVEVILVEFVLSILFLIFFFFFWGIVMVVMKGILFKVGLMFVVVIRFIFVGVLFVGFVGYVFCFLLNFMVVLVSD